MGSNAATAQTPDNVAQTATQSDALPDGGTVLIGIFGAKSSPQALVRTASGRVKRTKNGSRIASSHVVAIDAEGLILERNGQTRRLAMPGG